MASPIGVPWHAESKAATAIIASLIRFSPARGG